MQQRSEASRCPNFVSHGLVFDSSERRTKLYEREVKEASKRDRDLVVTVLYAAFQDDPVMRYILPQPDVRLRELVELFSLLFDEDLPFGRCLLTANGQASTLWQGPDMSRGLTAARVASGLPWFRTLGTACVRGLAYDNASNANRPKQRH